MSAQCAVGIPVLGEEQVVPAAGGGQASESENGNTGSEQSSATNVDMAMLLASERCFANRAAIELKAPTVRIGLCYY